MLKFFTKDREETPKDLFDTLAGEFQTASIERKQKLMEEMPLYINNPEKAWKYIEYYIKCPVMLSEWQFLEYIKSETASFNGETLLDFINKAFIICKNSELKHRFLILLDNIPSRYHAPLFRSFFREYKKILQRLETPQGDFFQILECIPIESVVLLHDYINEFKVTENEKIQYLKAGEWTLHKNALLEITDIKDERAAKELYQKSKMPSLLGKQKLTSLWENRNIDDPAWKEAFLTRWNKELSLGHKEEWYPIWRLIDKQGIFYEQCAVNLLSCCPEEFLIAPLPLKYSLFWEAILSARDINMKFKIFFPMFWDKEIDSVLDDTVDADLRDKVFLLAIRNLATPTNWEHLSQKYVAKKGINAFINFMDLLESQKLLNLCIKGKILSEDMFIALTLNKKEYIFQFDSPTDLKSKALEILTRMPAQQGRLLS
ncbi:MAG: hypothetical protein ACRC9L_04810 [Brevinema sp.]